MEKESSTSIFLQASLIQHSSASGLAQDKSKWVQAMRTGQSVPRGLLQKPGVLVYTAPLS